MYCGYVKELGSDYNMILTIDIGNSNTVLVGYDHDKNRVLVHRILTFKKHTKTLLSEVFTGIHHEIEDVIISCVVPRIQDEIVEAVESTFNLTPILINGKTIDKMEINIKRPHELGADLISTSVGAAAKYDAPVIVADIGSATKLTLTNIDNVYEGGIILPGLGSSLQSMVDMIPHLPTVDLSLPDSVVGKDTISAIQSGMLYGVVSQIEGLANRMELELGKPCKRVLTGGYTVIFKHLLSEFRYEPYLVNDGLVEIYLKDMYKK